MVITLSSVSQLNLLVSLTTSKDSPTMIIKRFIITDIERKTHANINIGPNKGSNCTASMKELEISSPNMMAKSEK